MLILCIREGLAVGEGDVQRGVFAVEVGAQASRVAGGFPMAHREVVKEPVAAGLGGGGRDGVLG